MLRFSFLTCLFEKKTCFNNLLTLLVTIWSIFDNICQCTYLLTIPFYVSLDTPGPLPELLCGPRLAHARPHTSNV